MPADALGVFAAHDQEGVVGGNWGLDQVSHDLVRPIEWDVPEDFVWHPRETEAQEVSVDDLDRRVALELDTEGSGEIAVQLDGDELPASLRQFSGECATPWADLHDNISAGDRRLPDKASRESLISQKVLR
jgi:hypothetical protein